MIPTSLAKREQRNYHCLKTWVPIVNRLRPMPSAEQWRSSQIAGRLLNGRTYDEMPAKRKESQLPRSSPFQQVLWKCGIEGMDRPFEGGILGL